MNFEFALVAIDQLRIHELVEDDKVEEVRRDIARRGRVAEPLLVDRDALVVLNGHHRLAALRALGARCAPVFLVAYADPSIRVERWSPGPAISKDEVIAHGLAGDPYPPKTTRHRLLEEPPSRSTALAELTDGRPPGP